MWSRIAVLLKKKGAELSSAPCDGANGGANGKGQRSSGSFQLKGTAYFPATNRSSQWIV